MPGVAPGRLVEVEGTLRHVMVQGGQGPVVVLESGLGGGVLEWEAVASALAASARVVRHDRPGLGRSGPAPQRGGAADRSSSTAARELKQLLEALDLEPPYLLVGHSLGGLHVRAFAGLYPDAVAGVVLVDPTHEDGARRVAALRWLTRLQVLLVSALLKGGPLGRSLLLRVNSASLVADCAKPLAPATAEVLRKAHELARTPSVLQTIGAEFRSLERSCEQVRTGSPFPPVPLRVISQARVPATRVMAALQRRWQALHAELLGLSPDSGHLLAGRSGHLVPLEQPEIVVDAVLDVLGTLQQEATGRDAAP